MCSNWSSNWTPRSIRSVGGHGKLLAIGPAALVQVQRLRQRKDLSVEVQERLDTLVKTLECEEAFDR